MDSLMTKVKSSNIDSIGHDSEKKLLYIKFLSGGLYSYYPVDTSMFVKFMKAKSKGGYFYKHIKNSKLKVQKVLG
jgi:hypothetical protein